MKSVLIIQNCRAESPGTILSYLKESDLKFQHLHTYAGDKLPEVEAVNAVINLGCPHSAIALEEQGFLQALFEFVKQAVAIDLPYLGICFGGQILAKAMAAEVRANAKKEIGTYQVKLTDEGKDSPLFVGFESDFPVFHWHGDTFDIPDGASRLATGLDCQNQTFSKGNMFGLQFHLEADPNEVPDWCNIYSEELAKFGSSKQEIVNRYKVAAATCRGLNYRMLDNFFSTATRPSK